MLSYILSNEKHLNAHKTLRKGPRIPGNRNGARKRHLQKDVRIFTMPLIKKFCYCFSLRSGALTIAYYCGDILLLWIISTVWNIISEMVLLTALHRDNPHLLPVHLVTCLCGLILEMTNHMWIASLGITDYILMSYAFFLIAYVAADVVVVLSYYQSEI
ncbi:uncharacterized protein LOC6529015 isoform X2 [Drosophila yakuba]|uniref:uncharacterized protein LOC6529015 isoform X2 n=1 Tax=Drosophila yakuba TaxID=7245 RepID=UPI0019307C5E|nr:uncharacterized protein LOC6529015 isoform X2 [Drosophila yakuba]